MGMVEEYQTTRRWDAVRPRRKLSAISYQLFVSVMRMASLGPQALGCGAQPNGYLVSISRSKPFAFQANSFQRV
jgi:hypothetical protein